MCKVAAYMNGPRAENKATDQINDRSNVKSSIHDKNIPMEISME